MSYRAVSGVMNVTCSVGSQLVERVADTDMMYKLGRSKMGRNVQVHFEAHSDTRAGLETGEDGQLDRGPFM